MPRKTAMAKKPVSAKPSLMSLLRGWFFAGLLVTAPIAVTIYVVWLIISFVDNQVKALLPSDLKFILELPGFGLVIGVVAIILVGALTTNLIGVSLIRIGESMVNRVPVARSVYGAIKQIMETVMASQSDAFREVVLIEYPRRGIWAIGFVTGSTRGEVQNMSSENLINVFVPTTPNPTSGFLLFFSREHAITLDMSVEEAVKMVVSGGIVTPDDPRAKRSRASLAAGAAGGGTKRKAGRKAGKKTARRKTARKKTAPKRAARKTVRRKTAAGKKGAGKKGARKKAARKTARKS